MEIVFNCLDMSEIDMDELKPNRLNLRLFDYIDLLQGLQSDYTWFVCVIPIKICLGNMPINLAFRHREFLF